MMLPGGCPFKVPGLYKKCVFPLSFEGAREEVHSWCPGLYGKDFEVIIRPFARLLFKFTERFGLNFAIKFIWVFSR